ncbi:hypothetical protein SEA_REDWATTLEHOG_169 [Gordonia phage RedWattleHog]|uniref:Uncharacterized protein n=1 Tax=Gordonia phage Stormageddon TaxID=2656541 RepID=A0A649VR85_9CAUD|nr:hypothetical protein KHQ86_gp130 [Gordonia phage Stormageddon]QGJ95030.1 hypothetical protein SEA_STORMAGEDDON_170 [Gordonia phage Stormageddon]QLF83672.1 hypothetical protein SEA_REDWATTLEHOG_169 [Gordonia phage RedWattleHog]
MTRDEVVAAAERGAAVIYRPHPDAKPEEGIVMRCNDRYAFVLFRGDTTAKATPFDLLEPMFRKM